MESQTLYPREGGYRDPSERMFTLEVPERSMRYLLDNGTSALQFEIMVRKLERVNRDLKHRIAALNLALQETRWKLQHTMHQYALTLQIAKSKSKQDVIEALSEAYRQKNKPPVAKPPHRPTPVAVHPPPPPSARRASATMRPPPFTVSPAIRPHRENANSVSNMMTGRRKSVESIVEDEEAWEKRKLEAIENAQRRKRQLMSRSEQMVRALNVCES